MYIIKHSFANEPEIIKLFKETSCLSDFKSKLLKLSKSLPKSNPKIYCKYSDTYKNEDKIKGKGFELFSELLVAHMGYHPHIGLSNYVPVIEKEDEGIDALAINLNCEKSAVQCKFVSDPFYEFTANGSNLGNFLIETGFQHIAWETEKIKRLFLITTAKGLHYHTEKKWRNCVYVIGNDLLKIFTDNNKMFWESCAQELNNINLAIKV